MQYPITKANAEAVKYAPPPDQAAQRAARYSKKNTPNFYLRFGVYLRILNEILFSVCQKKLLTNLFCMIVSVEQVVSFLTAGFAEELIIESLDIGVIV